MTRDYDLTPAREIHGPNAAKWKKFRPSSMGELHSRHSVHNLVDGVQVATLLTVIGEEAPEVYATFNDWEIDGDNKKLNQC